MSSKICLVVVYFGDWPVWFPAFLQSCKYNFSVDWVLFTDCKIPDESPENVKFFHFTMDQFNVLAPSKMGFKVGIEKAHKLCDFKPAYGCLFAEYLRDYDFWGYCDVDVVWGDIRAYITDDILGNYDIISSRKNHISGHFSLFKNTEEVSEIFKQIPDYEKLLHVPYSMSVDEGPVSSVIRTLSQEGKIKVFWERFLVNFSKEEDFDVKNAPSFLKRHINRWFWDRGKMYENGEEIMYLHMMTWKKSLKRCEFSYTDNPSSFYVSYSHISRAKKTIPWDLYLIICLQDFKHYLSFRQRIRRITNLLFKRSCSSGYWL